MCDISINNDSDNVMNVYKHDNCNTKVHIIIEIEECESDIILYENEVQ